MPITLVVPISLQMGWIESPGYFCVASETSRDVSTQYCQALLGSLPEQKFSGFIWGDPAYESVPTSDLQDNKFRFLIEVVVTS